MSRIRTVKPELFKHVDLYDLEAETGLPIRLAFISLFTVADREGRFKWIPRQLKVDCLPYDEIDFSRVLDALTTRGFLEKYRENGADYGWITGFKAHQVINNRESPSRLPAPNENNSLTRAPRVPHASTTREVHALGEGKGREGKENTDFPLEKSADDFEMFWKAVSTNWHGSPGAKQQARTEFEKLKPSQEEIDLMIKANIRQFAAAKELEEKGEFAERFKHVCRWLRFRMWEESKPSATVHPFTRNPNYPHLVKQAQELGESVDYEYGGEVLFISADGGVS